MLIQFQLIDNNVIYLFLRYFYIINLIYLLRLINRL